MPTPDDVSTVAWSEKSVASGKAVNVPQALVGLLSPDGKVRNRSYWQLDNEIVLQSDLYEAAYFVIPFLVRSLSEKAVYGRDCIYDLLYEIAQGDSPATVVCQTNDGDLVPLKEACARELNKGLSVFVRDSADGNNVISAKAKELLELLGANTSPDIAAAAPLLPASRGLVEATPAPERGR